MMHECVIHAVLKAKVVHFFQKYISSSLGENTFKQTIGGEGRGERKLVFPIGNGQARK